MARRKRQPVGIGLSADDLRWGRLLVCVTTDMETRPDVYQLYRSHDMNEPFPDGELEELARDFAERKRHVWATW